MKVFDKRIDFRFREGLAELALNEQPLRLFHDLRFARLGNAHKRAQRREVQPVLGGDDAQQERDRADISDLADRFEHRFAQRFLRVERHDRRKRGAVADLSQRFHGVELEP